MLPPPTHPCSSAPGVIFNDLNGDGKRTNVAGGKNNEAGVASVAFSVYVRRIVSMWSMGHPLTPSIPPESHTHKQRKCHCDDQSLCVFAGPILRVAATKSRRSMA